MNVAAANGRAGLRTERINRAHVAEHGPAEMMQMTFLHEIAGAGSGLVTPHPSDADGRVIEIRDVAVADRAIARMKNQHANRAEEITPARVDDAVLYGYEARL